MDNETQHVLIIVAELLGVASAICLLIPLLREGRLKLLLERLQSNSSNPSLENRRLRYLERMRETLTRLHPLDFLLLVAGIILGGLCSLIKLCVAFYEH
jgi:hypothetical protein